MASNADLPTTSVLFIDGYDSDRTYYANELKRCCPTYQILEAADGQSGLTRYRSQKINCVVLELNLPDTSGLLVLTDLVSLARRPSVTVLVLTRISSQPLWEFAKTKRAYDCS